MPIAEKFCSEWKYVFEFGVRAVLMLKTTERQNWIIIHGIKEQRRKWWFVVTGEFVITVKYAIKSGESPHFPEDIVEIKVLTILRQRAVWILPLRGQQLQRPRLGMRLPSPSNLAIMVPSARPCQPAVHANNPVNPEPNRHDRLHLSHQAVKHNNMDRRNISLMDNKETNKLWLSNPSH